MNTKPKADCSPKIEAETYRFSPGANIWLSPLIFLSHLESLKRLGLEIIFSPLWGGGEENDASSTEGTMVLRTNDGVLLGIDGTLQDCMDFVKALGFEPYTDDPYAFHYPHPKLEPETPEPGNSRRKSSEPIAIALLSFQAFDHGQEIEQAVSAGLDPKVGDRFGWECGCTISGTLEVTSVGETEHRFVSCKLKKVS